MPPKSKQSDKSKGRAPAVKSEKAQIGTRTSPAPASGQKGQKTRVRKPNFPVPKIHDHLTHGKNKVLEVEAAVPVFIAAVEEYLCFEILECASNLARSRGSTVIVQGDILTAIIKDKELNDALGGCINY